METLNIEKENVINAYNVANDEQKQMLESLFGHDVFRPKTIMDRIQLVSDAARELGQDHPLVKEHYALCSVEVSSNLINYSKLCMITAALNEGWEPKFTFGEYRYFPVFRLISEKEYNKKSKRGMKKYRVFYLLKNSTYEYCGVSSAPSSYDSSGVYAGVGTRLAFKTKELAEYAGKQFINLYAEYLLKSQ